MLDNARTIAELKDEVPSVQGSDRQDRLQALIINGEKSALWLRRIGELTASSIPHARTQDIQSKALSAHRRPRPSSTNRS